MSITSAKSGATGISLALENNYMEPIATTLVGSGGVATVTFNDIPQNYKHLQLRYIVPSASSDVNLCMNINGDISNNYTLHQLWGGAGLASAAGVASLSFIRIGYVFPASSYPMVGIIDILDYANTNKNTTTRTLFGWDNNANGNVGIISSLWNNTTSVSSLQITNAGGSSTILQHSRFSLYGIKG